VCEFVSETLKNWEEEGGGTGGKTICPLSENLNVRFPASRQIVLQESDVKVYWQFLFMPINAEISW